MHVSESFSSSFLPKQKKIEAAVFFYSLIQSKPYELCHQIITQAAESHSRGFEFEFYFIFVNSFKKYEFQKALELEAELIPFESIEYIDESCFKFLRERMQNIFKNSCSYVVFSDDETGSDCKTIEDNLPEFTSLGRIHIPLAEETEESLEIKG